MLEHIKSNKILFLDVETVSQKEKFDELSERWQLLWEKKARFLGTAEDTPEVLYERAAIYAEFGKIICISVGFLGLQDGKRIFRMKSFFGEDEKALLEEFANLLRTKFNSSDTLLCAHNGKEFDFPYLSRRMLINKIKLPNLLDLAGRKPWEVQHLDTLQLWKFGDYKHYTSLDLLSAIFNVDSPKDDIDGSQVGKIYYADKKKGLEKIVDYCEKDTLTVAQIFLSYKGEELIKKKEISKASGK